MENYLLPVRNAVESWLTYFSRHPYPEEINQDLLDGLSMILGFASCNSYIERELMLSNEVRELVMRWEEIGLVDWHRVESMIDRTQYLCDTIREQTLTLGLDVNRPVYYEFQAMVGHNLVMRIYPVKELRA